MIYGLLFLGFGGRIWKNGDSIPFLRQISGLNRKLHFGIGSACSCKIICCPPFSLEHRDSLQLSSQMTGLHHDVQLGIDPASARKASYRP